MFFMSSAGCSSFNQEAVGTDLNESVSEGKWMEVKMKIMLLGFEPRVRSKELVTALKGLRSRLSESDTFLFMLF